MHTPSLNGNAEATMLAAACAGLYVALERTVSARWASFAELFVALVASACFMIWNRQRVIAVEARADRSPRSDVAHRGNVR